MKARKLLGRIVLPLIVAVGILGLSAYAMRSMPYFTVAQVRLTSEGSAVPQSVKESVASFYGERLFGRTNSEREAEIEKSPYVTEAEVRYAGAHTLDVSLVTEAPEAFLSEEDAEGNPVSMMALKNGKLSEVSPLDAEAFGDSVVTLSVDPSYAAYLRAWGPDENLESLVRTAASLSLITRIGLDNNTSTYTTGRLVLRLDSLHADVCVREEVDPAVLQGALRVVRDEQDGTLHFGSARTRYDLYAHGLVKRAEEF